MAEHHIRTGGTDMTHKRLLERPVVVQPEDQLIRLIALTQGQVAIVDHSCYSSIITRIWFAAMDKRRGVYYGRSGIVKMHRLVIGASPGQIVDHINGNTLDNRRCNLRIVTPSENSKNKKVRSDSLSGYKGVQWRSKIGKWRVRITVDGELVSLGNYVSLRDAIDAYDAAAIKFHKQFARPNKPERR